MNGGHRVQERHQQGTSEAPLTPEGRPRSCLRIDAGRPIAHVASEAGISRRRQAKWYARWRARRERTARPRLPPRHQPRPHHRGRRRPGGGAPAVDQARAGPARRRPTAAARRHTRASDRPPHPGEARTQPAPGPRSTDRRAAVAFDQPDGCQHSDQAAELGVSVDGEVVGAAWCGTRRDTKRGEVLTELTAFKTLTLPGSRPSATRSNGYGNRL